jgi:hypothetical protein
MRSDIYDCYIIFNYENGEYCDIHFDSFEDAEEWAEAEGWTEILIEGTEVG